MKKVSVRNELNIHSLIPMKILLYSERENHERLDIQFYMHAPTLLYNISGRKITISKRCSGFVGLWENSILQSNYFEMPVSGLQSNIKDIIGFKMSSGATAVEFCGLVKQDNQDSCCPRWAGLASS